MCNFTKKGVDEGVITEICKFEIYQPALTCCGLMGFVCGASNMHQCLPCLALTCNGLAAWIVNLRETDPSPEVQVRRDSPNKQGRKAGKGGRRTPRRKGSRKAEIVMTATVVTSS